MFIIKLCSWKSQRCKCTARWCPGHSGRHHSNWRLVSKVFLCMGAISISLVPISESVKPSCSSNQCARRPILHEILADHQKSTQTMPIVPGQHQKAHNDVNNIPHHNHTTYFLRGWSMSTSTQSTTFRTLKASPPARLCPPLRHLINWLSMTGGPLPGQWRGRGKDQRSRRERARALPLAPCQQGPRAVHSSRKLQSQQHTHALHTDDWARPHVKLANLSPTGY